MKPSPAALVDAARELLAEGVDPSKAKRQEKQNKNQAAANTFESIAQEWLTKTQATRKKSTQTKVQRWLEKNVFPYLGKLPISTLGPRDVLEVLRKIEARDAVDSAHRIKQLIGQVFRFAVATGSAERDITTDLRGALSPVSSTHFPAITDPKQVSALMRSIFAYEGQAPAQRNHHENKAEDTFAEPFKSSHNELLEEAPDGSAQVDTRATAAATRSDSEMETVDTIDRTKKRRR